MGVGLRAKAKALECPPNPKVYMPIYTENVHSGRSNLGGEQTRGPEH